MFRSAWSGKRLLGMVAALIGLAAAVLILLAATAGNNFSLHFIAIGLGVLYGSYLIYRGKTSLLFGWGKTRLGAWVNLILGVLTLIIPGGVGGEPAVLAIVSGVLALFAV